MAGIGLSKPYVAVYTYDPDAGTVSYGVPVLAGKAITMELSLDDAGDNVLYADNGPAEEEKRFAGGTVTLGTDQLSPSIFGTIYGITPEAIGTSTTDKWYKSNDDQATPFLGVGAVRKHMVGGAIKYQAVVLLKVSFANLAESMETQGESISWQTPEITGTIYRSDMAKHDWRWVSTLVDTEAEAEAFIAAALD